MCHLSSFKGFQYWKAPLAFTTLKFLSIFEQGAPHFPFSWRDPTSYIAGPVQGILQFYFPTRRTLWGVSLPSSSPTFVVRRGPSGLVFLTQTLSQRGRLGADGDPPRGLAWGQASNKQRKQTGSQLLDPSLGDSLRLHCWGHCHKAILGMGTVGPGDSSNSIQLQPSSYLPECSPCPISIWGYPHCGWVRAEPVSRPCSGLTSLGRTGFLLHKAAKRPLGSFRFMAHSAKKHFPGTGGHLQSKLTHHYIPWSSVLPICNMGNNIHHEKSLSAFAENRWNSKCFQAPCGELFYLIPSACGSVSRVT